MARLGIESIEDRQLMAANLLGGLEIVGPTNEPAALLLPAIQKVREAAAQTETMPVEMDLTSGQDPAQIGLLLPAVQKVREAAARMKSMPVEWSLTTGEDPVAIGLLLPAVQKIR